MQRGAAVGRKGGSHRQYWKSWAVEGPAGEKGGNGSSVPGNLSFRGELVLNLLIEPEGPCLTLRRRKRMPGRHGKLQWTKQREVKNKKRTKPRKALWKSTRVEKDWRVSAGDFRHLLLLATRWHDNPDLRVGKACHNPWSFEESCASPWPRWGWGWGRTRSLFQAGCTGEGVSQEQQESGQ